MRIVILGGGFAGVQFLTTLLRQLKRKKGEVSVTLVSNENFFLFTPLLHEVATGGVGTRHIAYPIRRFPSRTDFTFIQAEVLRIDLEGRSVLTSEGRIGYDRLVLALGSISDMSELPAGTSQVFELKTLRQAMLIRNHIIRSFEKADAEPDPDKQRQLLTFVVVGAGYTGVQLVTEMHDFIHQSLIKYYSRLRPDMVRLMLVQPQEKILIGMPPRLGDYSLRLLQKKGMEVRLNSRVTGLNEEGVTISGTEFVPTCMLVWAAGIKASPLVSSLPVEKDKAGRIVVNEYLEVPGYPGVYALGDNAHSRDPVTGEAASPTAHNAVRQARVAAVNVAAELLGRPRKPYRHPFRGGLVSLGARNAVINIYGLRLHGFLARMIWLIAYSSLVTGTYNRIRVALDWILGVLFGRDTALLDIR